MSTLRVDAASAATVPSTVPAAAASAAPAAVSTGSLSIEAVDVAGGNLPIDAALATVTSNSGAVVGRGSTDATGRVVITLIPAGTDFTVTLAQSPGSEYVPGTTAGVTIRAGSHTYTAVKMRVGATIAGTLTTPGRSPAGIIVQPRFGPPGWLASTTDVNGHFSLTGLQSGDYFFSVTSAEGTVTTWSDTVSIEHGDVPATNIQNENHWVHSSYDLIVSLSPSALAPSWQGAPLILRNLASGATYSEHADLSNLTSKSVRFVVPSGRYTLEAFPTDTGGPTPPPLWHISPDEWSTDAASAVPFSITFGQYEGLVP